MSQPSPSPVNRAYILTLILLAAIFLTSLFKHISYPLLWNDEAETVSFGQSIIHHGYPKIHDGKNVIYPLLNQNLSLGEDKKTDAFIGSGWGGFYFSTIGIALASLTDDLYAKTALLRIPFALLGAFAIALFACIGCHSFRKHHDRALFLLGFFSFEMLSVSLVLHLREVRYYSPVFFLSASLLYLYVRYRISATVRFRTFGILSVILLFLLFNTFIPAYIALVLLFIADSFWSAFRSVTAHSAQLPSSDRTVSRLLVPEGKFLLIPLISLATICPVAWFFKTAEISRAITGQLGFTTARYFAHLKEITTTLGTYEFFYLALFAKCFLLLCRVLTKNCSETDENKYGIRISNLLGLYAILYMLAVSRLPFSSLYERYFIILQPVLAVSILLDAMTTFKLLAAVTCQRRKRILQFCLVAPCICLFGYTMANKLPSLKGHCYELAHPYYGPLDFAIVYIKKNFPDTERLVIATNYEENAYMYYLGSKVTIGYVGKNLFQDMLVQPDIIIYRSQWSNFLPVFRKFLLQGDYETVPFPVADLRVNNIPELRTSHGTTHHYKTEEANSFQLPLILFVKRH